nr:immunoglobulin light chain junction region [Macaca mulatta]MOY15199.1 immunoglobulin light chain junction region [Macaca mulatta]MOY16553.1 immunoglobulin light chain junction region [Macaca mulatta]MOY16613.1 immunoglobulin light chain junction region [Macaca mulatta]MOY17128.1 immunoglobulin light chain junction region [Macaca mulatta]
DYSCAIWHTSGYIF